MKHKETLTALLFLCALAGGMVLLAASFFGGEGHLESALKTAVADPAQLPAFLAGAESVANQDLDRSHAFIQLYGGVQRLMGRRVVVDMADPDYTVVKLDDGALAFQNLAPSPAEQTGHADAVAHLKHFLDARNLPFLYLQAPQKIQGDNLPAGMENFGNQDADQLLSLLSERGVDTLDLRPGIAAAAAESHKDFYFRTDHHWTPQAGFAACQILSEELDTRYGYPADPTFTDPAQYDVTTYPDWFLGSQGKRVGTLYAGVDSIDFWSPKFKTDFTYTAGDFFPPRSGSFEETLLFPERLEPMDYFAGNPYTLYSGGDYPLARMVNHQNPDGPRILLIRDSFSCAMAPFLALQCSELMTMDMRYFSEDLGSYIDWLQPDLVMVMYTVGTTRLDHMYPFLESVILTE